VLSSSATKARRGHNGPAAYFRRSARGRLCGRLFLPRAHIQAKAQSRAASLSVADTAGRAPMKFTSFARAHSPRARRETSSRHPTRWSANQVCTSCLLLHRGNGGRMRLDLGQRQATEDEQRDRPRIQSGPTEYQGAHKKARPAELGAGCGSGYCRESITSTGTATCRLQSGFFLPGFAVFRAFLISFGLAQRACRTTPHGRECFCKCAFAAKTQAGFCENHPDQPWEGPHACSCGGAGMPCPVCNPSTPDEPPAPAEWLQAR
jgi:hypothetical protein